MTGMLELATRLRSLDESTLTHVIESHELTDEHVDDYFDLAERLLSPTAVQQALTHLKRSALAALAVAAEGVGTSLGDIERLLVGTPAIAGDPDAVLCGLRAAHELCLVDLHGETVGVFEPVARRLADWPDEGLPSRVHLITEPRPEPSAVPPSKEAEERSGARAFATVTSTAEVVESLRANPARELQRGGLAQPDERRLAAAIGGDAREVATALGLTARARLVALESRQWLVTEQAHDWISLPTRERWQWLVDAWLDAVPTRLRRLLTDDRLAWGSSLLELVAWEYPAAVDLRREAEVALGQAESLGLSVDGIPTPLGRLLVTDAKPGDAAPPLPSEVETVYIQHDLTIVAPGPLHPEIDSRLRGMAELEHRVPASTYRVTPASVNSAIARGETAESITQFLTHISLTGIPQPLEYLIADASERYGRLRVAPGEHGSVVCSDDTALLDTLAVDHTLAPLGLSRESLGRLISPRPRDVAYWALIQARYPVVAEERDGSPVTPSHGRVARAHTPPPRAAARLAARLIASRGNEDGAARAWTARQLEAAIRSRATVAVTLRMPDGTTTERDFEPLGVSGGRVRGRDRDAAVERTFPLTSVESVRPVR